MVTAPPVPHHYVLTGNLLHPDTEAVIGLKSLHGVIDWPYGETRHDQYLKVLDIVRSQLGSGGLEGVGFATTFWSLERNRLQL